jgi:DNA modification methylase
MIEIRDRIVSLQRIKASDLAPNRFNFRRHGPAQSSALRHLLHEIGYSAALLAYPGEDGKLTLVDGHLRRELTPNQEVPVLVTDLTEAEARVMLRSLDPLAAMASEDDAALAALIEQIDDAGLEQLLGGLDEAPGGLLPEVDPDEIPSEVETRCQPGDLWALGEHRLLCGDSTKAIDVRRLMGSEIPRLMVTDPPYGVDYDPKWRNAAAAKGLIAFAARREGTVSNDDRVSWAEAWKMFPGSVIYCWHADRHASEVAADLAEAGFEIRNQIIWRKPRFVISRGHYHWQHEPCWYAVRKDANAGWKGDRSQSTVWDIALTTDGQKTDHGTQKPVECMLRPIKNHEGDVYDPFLGSGTTIMAAETLGRRCFAMEVDPGYCDVALTRFEQATGKAAVQVEADS